MTRSLKIALLPVLVLTGCYNVVDGGPEAFETRTPQAFTKVRLDSGLTASFKPGEPTVTIASQQKVIENIETVVRDGLLVVRIKPGVKISSLNWTAVTIAGAGVTELGASAGATLIASDLAAEKVKLSAVGGAAIYATGAVNEVQLESFAGSTVSSDLASQTAKVDAAGGSTIEVTASGAVSGTASGGSRIKATGNADLSKITVSGGSTVEAVDVTDR